MYSFTNYGSITSISTTTTSVAVPPPNATYVYIPYGWGYPYAQFEPGNVTVMIGVNNTVVWVNQDTIVHDVVSVNGTFSGGDLSHNQVYTFTFTQPGVYPYYCSYHPSHQGEIVVKT